MLNKTNSTVVVKMRNIDHAEAIKKALSFLPKDTGGDTSITIKTCGKELSVNIGHDINVKGVEHFIGTDYEINVGDELDYIEYETTERMPVVITKMFFDGYVFLVEFKHENSNSRGVTQHTDKLKKRIGK